MNLGPLRRDIRAGRVVLFTGAGFSVHAQDPEGRNVPLGGELGDELWRMCYDGEPRDRSTLADLFEQALATHPDELAELCRRRLVVDAATLPRFYEDWLRQPWRRIYTLNVDDLERAAARRFRLPCKLRSLSALRPPAKGRRPRGTIDVVHLNGLIDDGPDGITFSTVQYGDRLANRDVWYRRLVADLAAHPFLFVGTRLDEPPLWQHMQLGPLARRDRRHVRPISYLVAPRLTRARASLLEAYRIRWLPMTTDEFAAAVLT